MWGPFERLRNRKIPPDAQAVTETDQHDSLIGRRTKAGLVAGGTLLAGLMLYKGVNTLRAAVAEGSPSDGIQGVGDLIASAGLFQAVSIQLPDWRNGRWHTLPPAVEQNVE